MLNVYVEPVFYRIRTDGTERQILAACGNDSAKSNSNLLFTEPYPDSDTLAQTIFNPAIMFYRYFRGINHLRFDGYRSDYFYSDDYPDYFIEE